MPSVLDAAAPEIQRANLPVGLAAAGYPAATAAGVAAATARLGYPAAAQQRYFAGFVLEP